MTAIFKYLKGWPVEEFSFLFAGQEGRNWDQWVDIILTVCGPICGRFF